MKNNGTAFALFLFFVFYTIDFKLFIHINS